MKSGFVDWKDVVEVVTIPVALAILTLAWPAIQSWYRSRRFKVLTRRELTEIGPFPKEATNTERWTQHLRKSFLHQKIIKEISANRDFVLGLEPGFIYSVSQLWESYEDGDATQWLWYLKSLASHRYLRRVKRRLMLIRNEWSELIDTSEWIK